MVMIILSVTNDFRLRDIGLGDLNQSISANLQLTGGQTVIWLSRELSTVNLLCSVGQNVGTSQ